jgi:hypothetical protein
MADSELLYALNDCLDRLAAGQSVEDCLHNHPHHAIALRPMLEAGLIVRRSRVSSVEVARAQDRVRFRLAQYRPRRRSLTGFLLTAASLLILVMFALGALGLAGESSLPGDALYGFKRLAENVRILVSSDVVGLHQEIAERRRAEVIRLLALRRAEDVDFEGELQAKEDLTWRVADLAVVVTPATQGAQSVDIGDVIEVYGSTTTTGELVARSVTQIQPGIPSPTPTASATSTPARTATQTFTATATPSRTPVPPRRIPTSPPQFTPTANGGNSGPGGGDDGGHHDGGGSDNSGPGSSSSGGDGSGSGSHGSGDGE